MKAVLLAAGKGERIKELSTLVPKPMFIYNNKPILQHNIELCKHYNITELFINTHHHSEQIIKYFGNGDKYNVHISYSLEEKLLGTSGALNNFKKELKDSPFFVIYGDQIADFNLMELVERFNNYDCLGTIAFHYRDDVIHSGVAEFDENFRVIKFIEKPKPEDTDSHWVNAGIYYLSPSILDYIPDGNSDFGKEIFPELLIKNKSLYGVCKHKEVKVFDTPEMYNKNISGK